MTVAEIAAVILGLISVYLVTRQNVWCYPLGIISVFIYLFIFFEVKLYADMGLQLFFIVLQVYGWYQWLYGGADHSALRVTRAHRSIHGWTVIFTAAATAGLGYILHRNTDASIPFLDSFLAALSMAAQWMMAKKYIENWILWMAVNIGSIGMFGYKELYLTMVLYGVYLVLAVVGYIEWQRSMERQRVSGV